MSRAGFNGLGWLWLTHTSLTPVPVTRAADLAKMGVGKLYIEESDPLRIIGVGTQFKKQCVVRGQLVLPKHVGYAQGEIAEIISDTEIR